MKLRLDLGVPHETDEVWVTKIDKNLLAKFKKSKQIKIFKK